MIAYRSAYICANPRCNRLTVAPSLNDAESKVKIGEAAHIHDAREMTIRFDQSMSLADRAKAENGIWLCASCHTEIDKNRGIDYPAEVLKKWKKDHEDLISDLLRHHKSPLPLIRRFTNDQKLAQKIVDIISNKGVFHQAHYLENLDHVILSLKEVRKSLVEIGSKIDFDKKLKEINENLKKALKEYMNDTSQYPVYSDSHMDVLRKKVGISLRILRDEFGCSVDGSIVQIMP
ncbi:HNH endonuclease [Vreelandella venusta]|nr:HNH endonuclease [Halomonas venusta]